MFAAHSIICILMQMVAHMAHCPVEFEFNLPGLGGGSLQRTPKLAQAVQFEMFPKGV